MKSIERDVFIFLCTMVLLALAWRVVRKHAVDDQGELMSRVEQQIGDPCTVLRAVCRQPQFQEDFTTCRLLEFQKIVNASDDQHCAKAVRTVFNLRNLGQGVDDGFPRSEMPQ